MAEIEETGTLVRDGGGFALNRDAGGPIRLELARAPVDHVEKRVRVRGTVDPAGVFVVTGVAGA